MLEFFEAYQNARARLPAVRGRADDLPAGPVRVGRQARQAADGLLDRADLGPERAPGLPAGLGRELPRLEAERGGREPRPVVEDRVHHQLRRERRPVRSRRAAVAARRHRRTSSSRSPASRTGRSGAASGCRASSSRPGRSAASSPSEQFDHTSVLQFLERLTGVKETNISDWRRQTFGDLTSALGFSNGKATTFPPRLPATIGEFWEAEHEVATLPAATIPGAAQTPPVQETRRRSAPVEASGAPLRARHGTRAHFRPRPAASSRTARRTRPTSSSGGSDKVYLSKIAAVAEQDCGGRRHRHDVRVCTGNRRRQRRDRRHLDDGACVARSPSGMTNPYGVAATPDGSEVWVTESGTNTVSVIPTGGSTPNKIASTVVVGIYPHGIAITPDGKTAYVANTGPNTGRGGSETVSVVDVSSQTETGTVRVGEAPQVVTISPDGSLAFVTCADGVYVIGTSNGHVSQVSERAAQSARGGGDPGRQPRVRDRLRARPGGGGRAPRRCARWAGSGSARRRGTRRSTPTARART